jgi:hypothetical protein
MMIQVVFYAFTFWLGMYLIARDLTSPRLRWAGLGLVSYSLAISMDLLASKAVGSTAEQLQQLHWALMQLPAVLWAGAVLELFPEGDKLQPRLVRIWGWVVVPLVLLAVLLFALGIGLWSDGEPTLTGYIVYGLTSLLPLIALLFLLLRLKQVGSTRRAVDWC